MKSVLNTLKSAYNYTIEMHQRKRMLTYLQTLTERNLLDKGFAPHLIAEGIRAYPWTAVKVEMIPLNISVVKPAIEMEKTEETIGFATAA